jgi:hypothetical protein
MVSTEQRASTERGPGGQLTAEITSVVKLMQTMKLDIPAYQRPYTWTAKNVSQLVSDIRRFSSAGHYRIGTFILHPSPSEEVGNAGETLDMPHYKVSESARRRWRAPPDQVLGIDQPSPASGR